MDDEMMNEFLDNVTATASSKSVTLQYHPDRGDVMRHIRGTVLQKTFRTAIIVTLANVALNLKIKYLFKAMPTMQAEMEVIDRLWKFVVSLTTFVLGKRRGRRATPITLHSQSNRFANNYLAAFFLNQSYSLYQNVLSLTRQVQGRLNDVSMISSTHAARSKDGSVTPTAQASLDTIARYKRLFIMLFYATVSKKHSILTTPRALMMLRERGIVGTDDELQTLLELPVGMRSHCVAGWITAAFVKGNENGAWRVKDVAHYFIIEKMSALR